MSGGCSHTWSSGTSSTKIPVVFGPFHGDDERVLTHPANAAAFAWLRERTVQRPDGGYEEHTHPDLADLLRTAGEDLGARFEYFFGFPTLVSSNGVVFALALGTSSIVFRAPAGGFSRDLPAGPRTRAAGDQKRELLTGWVQTYAWLGSRLDWTVREGDAAIDERFIEAAIAAEQVPDAAPPTA
jgi:hypothetical protein